MRCITARRPAGAHCGKQLQLAQFTDSKPCCFSALEFLSPAHEPPCIISTDPTPLASMPSLGACRAEGVGAAARCAPHTHAHSSLPPLHTPAHNLFA